MLMGTLGVEQCDHPRGNGPFKGSHEVSSRDLSKSRENGTIFPQFVRVWKTFR